MSERSPQTVFTIGGGVLLLGVGFVFLGQLSLAAVALGAGLFLSGALLLGGGAQRVDPSRRGLLAKACLGFGAAGLALSALMAAVSPFTGQRSQTLGLVTGAVGALAGLILIGAGVAALRRLPPESD